MPYSGHTVRLYLENGEDVGTFSSATSAWSVGDTFKNGDGNRFRIVDMLEDFDELESEFNGVWKVTSVKVAEPD